MSNLQIFAMFLEINRLAQKTGESIVPINCTMDSMEYYADQMENLGFNQEQIDSFVEFLRANGNG